MIQIRPSTREAERVLTDLVQKQLPYAMSKAVNAITLEARDYLRQRNQGAFIVRRPWVLQGYRVKLSTKRDTPIKARLWLDPSRDFLSKFEKGGSKHSRTGASLAIPLSARTSKAAIVPDRLRIRSLHLTATRTKAGKVQIKGDQRTFMVKTGGRTLLLQRTARNGIKTLYVFKRSVPIPASLHFYDSIGSYVRNEWPHVMGEALSAAIRTAR